MKESRTIAFDTFINTMCVPAAGGYWGTYHISIHTRGVMVSEITGDASEGFRLMLKLN